MYQLLEEILPYFVAFYVLDSLAFVAAGEVLFARRFRHFIADRVGPVLAGLLPTAEALSTFELPVRLSEKGVAWPTPDGFAHIPWKDLGLVLREDRTVSAAGRSLRAPSPEAAERVASLLVRLREAKPARREEELEALFDEASDATAVLALRQRSGRFARALEVLGFVLLAGLFGLIPLGLAGRFALAPDPAWILLALVPVYGAILVLSWLTLKGCGLGAGRCLATLGTLFFFPPAAAHVRSLLSRRLFSSFEPVALAAVLLPAPAFRDFARERFHRLRLEVGETGLEEHAVLAEKAWRRAVAASGQSAEDVLRPPESTDRTASSYCPLCSTEYRRGFTACSECRVALLPLLSVSAIAAP